MNYELVLMIKPNLSEEDAKKEVALVKESIKGLKGDCKNEDFWGKRKLSYEINRFQDAFYSILLVELDPSQVKKLDSKLTILPNLMRHMIATQDMAESKLLHVEKSE